MTMLSFIYFWLPAAILCLAAIGMLLLASRTKLADEGRSEASLSIYKDQLAELSADIASGSITQDEAEAQRVEISRRLLAASREMGVKAPASSAFPKWAVLVVPVLAGLIYWQVGNYGLGDVPRQARLAASETTNDWPALLARVEDHLDKNPKDLEGWKLLVPNYVKLGRYADAANAIGSIIEISGPTAQLYADMAEALVFDNKGLMTQQSFLVVQEALKLDPKYPKARYYAALNLMQEGKKDEAKAAFASLLAEAPADAPYRKTVEDQIARLSPNATAPEISKDQMQSAEGMTVDERTAMIRSMVDGLDQKLKDNPQDVEGWLRLVRARTVLQDNDKAIVALAMARQTFAGKPEETKLLDELATELKLQ
jgi:cytochrome c-type biogenesis protein CcmH